MKLLVLSRKIFILAFIALFMVSLYINITGYADNEEWKQKYESLACVAGEISNGRAAVFIASGNSLTGKRQAEVFDISKGKVVKTLEMTDEIKTEALKGINSINGLFVKANPLPDKGIIIRIPLGADVSLNNHWVQEIGIKEAQEVFFIYTGEVPGREKSFILLLDSSYRPFFFTHEADDIKLLSFFAVDKI